MDYFNMNYDFDLSQDGTLEAASDQLLYGSANDAPTVSTPMQTSNGSPFSKLVDLLGSIGTVARDLGTAVGKTEADIKAAQGNYQTARQNALSGNTLGTWWQYASMTDKLVVGLAAAGVVFAAYSVFKGK